MIIAGVMSGSSLDGIDIAIVEFRSDNSWDLLWTYDIAYSDNWVQRIKNYQQLSAIDFITFTTEYSAYIGRLLIDAFSTYSGQVDFVSFHGHTLIHLPQKGITKQMGNGGVIAALLGIPTITDFRIQDVIKGGVGTPLAPLVEINLFEGHDYYLNLGGIANITKIGKEKKPIAYDVCPFNQVMNHYSNKMGFEYDEDGKIARSGSLKSELFDYLDAIPYFQLKAPKSLDNNWIVDEFIPKIPRLDAKDILNTFCHWTAICISIELEESETSKSLMVTGGGAHNIYFMECLREALSKKNCSLYVPLKEIIDFKEAILMSLMAYKYLEGEINVLSSVTGASSDTIGGALYKI